jgi:Tol biopolymer transport system component
LVDKFTGEAREVHVSEYKLLRDLDCSLRAGLILAVTQGAEKVQLRIFKSDGSEQRTLAAEGDEIYSARWSASGDSIYYLHGRGSTSELSQFPVTGRHGEPTAIAGGLQTGTFFTISADDARLAYTREDDNSNLWRVDLPTSGTKPRPKISRLTSGTSHYGAPSFSPDGHWIAFPLGPKRDETNIFKMQVTGGEPVQLTFFEHAETNSPAWSPDGQRIAFISDQNGSPKVWITNADGGTPQRLENTNASDTNGRLSWWPSREIFYQKAGCRNYLRLDDKTQTEGTVIQQDESVGWVPWRPVFSPDGKQIAFQWNREDRGLWIISLKPYFETFMIVGGIYPFGWSPDGKYVYAIPRAGQQAVRIRVAAPHEITSVAILPSDSVDFDSASMSPDGREFVVIIYEKKSDVWVMENFNSSALGTSTQ